MSFFDWFGMVRVRNDQIAELKRQKHDLVIKFQEARNQAATWQGNHRDVSNAKMRLALRYRMLLNLAREMSGAPPEVIEKQVDDRLRTANAVISDWKGENDANDPSNTDQPVGKPFHDS